MSGDGNDPVIAYALATGALLMAACLMCIILMCCAKCPEWRRRRRAKREKERLMMYCKKIKFSSKKAHEKGVPGDTCAVCLEEFKERETVMMCPCNHGYHKICLSDWVVQCPRCPLCKSQISLPSLKKPITITSSSDSAAVTEATALLS